MFYYFLIFVFGEKKAVWGFMENKWLRAVLPALLIHCSIGTVYCWSLFKADIAVYIEQPLSQVEWAFSLAIFVLGMSAAFGGKFVEKNIKKSSLYSTLFFVAGMVGTGAAIYFKSLLGIYIFYGIVMGIGLGIGYLTPVKNLMLWFIHNKGLATGLAVAGFGLAKVIASPIMERLLGETTAAGTLVHPENVYKMFFILAIGYLVMMMIGHLVIKKPNGWVEPEATKVSFNYLAVLKNKTFIGIWLMFYLNITCGLALIAQEKALLGYVGFTAVALVSSLSAVFNAGGRLAYSAWADRLKDRNTIYKVVFISTMCAIAAVLIFDALEAGIPFLIITLLCVINAGYGGGFSNLPTLLADRYGLTSISTIHGLTLSAWAFAGLSGNQLASFIVAKTGSYEVLLYVLFVLFAIAAAISFFVVKPSKVEIPTVNESASTKTVTV